MPSLVTRLLTVGIKHLLRLYTLISRMLQGKVEKILVSGFMKSDAANGSLKKRVARLRTAGFLLRREVKLLGGVPLGEPLAYWRFEYPIVAF